MTDASTLIHADALGLTWPGGQTALRDVNLRIAAGEFVSLIGPSGCGKSTLLRLLAGLTQPTAGRLAFDDAPPAETRRAGRRVAFVFQDSRLLPWRNVTDNIRLPLELQQSPRAQHSAPVRESLRLIGLTDADARKSPGMLSGGMRMRVALARALVTQPDLLLLDEPFAALDDILRQQLGEDLLRIWTEKRWTAAFVTHNVAEAVFLSSRVLVMTARPGTIAAEVAVPFGYPREPDLRADPAFAKLTGEVSRQLRKAAA